MPLTDFVHHTGNLIYSNTGQKLHEERHKLQKLHEERMGKHKLQKQRILFTVLGTETEESDEKDLVIFNTFFE